MHENFVFIHAILFLFEINSHKKCYIFFKLVEL